MSDAWYKKGLRFSCTGCGKCCTGSPGVVWVDDKEIEEMANFLNLSVKEFSMKYLRKVNGRISLVELKKNYDCIFLKDKKCLVYGARPKQCRTFPFWQQNLNSETTWEEAGRQCEGINEDAPIVSYEEIQTQLNASGENDEQASNVDRC